MSFYFPALKFAPERLADQRDLEVQKRQIRRKYPNSDCVYRLILDIYTQVDCVKGGVTSNPKTTVLRGQ